MERERAVGLELRSLTNLIKRKFERIHKDSSKKIFTPMQGMIVEYVYSHAEEDIFQRDIEEKFTIRRSTVSKILQLMESKGYIIREAVPYDARLKRIVLSEETKEIHKATLKCKREVDGIMMQNFTKREEDEFYRLLRKMQHNLREDEKKWSGEER
ncbi:MAG: MarR family winged helix-turn-helix transcriptional regulator [Lachnospiraceae bacterium]